MEKINKIKLYAEQEVARTLSDIIGIKKTIADYEKSSINKFSVEDLQIHAFDLVKACERYKAASTSLAIIINTTTKEN